MGPASVSTFSAAFFLMDVTHKLLLYDSGPRGLGFTLLVDEEWDGVGGGCSRDSGIRRIRLL